MESETSIYQYRTINGQFAQFFSQEEYLVEYQDFVSLMNEFGLEYKKEDGRPFIKSSQMSSKGVLLHNGNTYTSLLVIQSILSKLTETLV